jgi:hypothetical protein
MVSRETVVQFASEARDAYLRQNVQVGSEAHKLSNSNRSTRGAGHLSPFYVEAKNEWRYASILSYALQACTDKTLVLIIFFPSLNCNTEYMLQVLVDTTSLYAFIIN